MFYQSGFLTAGSILEQKQDLNSIPPLVPYNCDAPNKFADHYLLKVTMHAKGKVCIVQLHWIKHSRDGVLKESYFLSNCKCIDVSFRLAIKDGS